MTSLLAARIGREMRRAREALGLTVAQVGDRLDYPEFALERMEAGRTTPSIHLFWRICLVLGMDSNKALGLHEPDSAEQGAPAAQDGQARAAAAEDSQDGNQTRIQPLPGA